MNDTLPETDLAPFIEELNVFLDLVTDPEFNMAEFLTLEAAFGGRREA
jgi:hypothetical protein